MKKMNQQKQADQLFGEIKEQILAFDLTTRHIPGYSFPVKLSKEEMRIHRENLLIKIAMLHRMAKGIPCSQ